MKTKNYLVPRSALYVYPDSFILNVNVAFLSNLLNASFVIILSTSAVYSIWEYRDFPLFHCLLSIVCVFDIFRLDICICYYNLLKVCLFLIFSLMYCEICICDYDRISDLMDYICIFNCHTS